MVTLCARLLKEIRGSCLAGKEHDLAAGQHCAHLDRGVNPVEVPHDDVSDEQVRPEAARELDGCLAAVRDARLVTGSVEDHLQGVGNDSLIVYNKYFQDVAVIRSRFHVVLRSCDRQRAAEAKRIGSERKGTAGNS